MELLCSVIHSGVNNLIYSSPPLCSPNSLAVPLLYQHFLHDFVIFCDVFSHYKTGSCLRLRAILIFVCLAQHWQEAGGYVNIH